MHQKLNLNVEYLYIFRRQVKYKSQPFYPDFLMLLDSGLNIMVQP